MRAARWIKNGCIVLVLAAALHVLVVWLIPRVITGAFLRKMAAQDGYNPVSYTHLREATRPRPDAGA